MASPSWRQAVLPEKLTALGGDFSRYIKRLFRKC
jgi:hypothetical protein